MTNNRSKDPKTLERKLAKQFEFSVSGPVEQEKDGLKWHEFPVTLKARDGGPLLHSWWGKIAHDFSGMSVPSVGRIPIDHVHTDEALGYIDQFDTSSGHLILKGRFVSTKEGDLPWTIATQILAKIPYQSSIFFDDPEDGELVIDDVRKGKSVTANGLTWEGPGLLVSKWLLRGVAVCLYGADSKTSTQVLKHQSTPTPSKSMDPVELLKKFTEMFGAKLANQYVIEGLSLEEATMKFNAVLTERIEAVKKLAAEKEAEIGNLKTQLAAVGDQAAQLAARDAKVVELETKLTEANNKLAVWEKQYGGLKYGDVKPNAAVGGNEFSANEAEKKFAEELKAILGEDE